MTTFRVPIPSRHIDWLLEDAGARLDTLERLDVSNAAELEGAIPELVGAMRALQTALVAVARSVSPIDRPLANPGLPAALRDHLVALEAAVPARDRPAIAARRARYDQIATRRPGGGDGGSTKPPRAAARP